MKPSKCPAKEQGMKVCFLCMPKPQKLIRNVFATGTKGVKV